MTTESHKPPFQRFKRLNSFHQNIALDEPGRLLRLAGLWCRRLAAVAAVLIFPFLIGCGASPRIVLQYGSEFTQSDLAKVLAENPLGASENVRLTTLGQGPDASQHIVQIREREIPHTHDTHDTTIFMMRGHGYLVMDGRRIDLTAGDVIHIPRAIPHYYVNTASEPTVAFVVFAPPFDGKDNMPLSAR